MKTPPEPGSEPLDNARHERFACELAAGCTKDEAYVKAGFERHESNCSRLSGNERVLERVKWLKLQAQDDTVLTLKEKRQIAAQIARQGEKDADRLGAIKVDNDLAVHGSEAKAADAVGTEAQILGKFFNSLVQPGNPIPRRVASARQPASEG